MQIDKPHRRHLPAQAQEASRSLQWRRRNHRWTVCLRSPPITNTWRQIYQAHTRLPDFAAWLASFRVIDQEQAVELEVE